MSDTTSVKSISGIIPLLQEIKANGLFIFVQTADGRRQIPFADEKYLHIFDVAAQTLAEDAGPAFAKVELTDLDDVMNSLNWSIKHRQPWVSEFRIQDAEGKTRWLAAILNPVDGFDEEFVAMGYITEITALKEAEFNHEFEFDVKTSESTLRAALAAVGDGIWDWNPLSDHVYFSPTWKKMIGYEDHEVNHSLDEWLNRQHPDEATKTLDAVKAHLDGETEVYRDEHRIRCKDGSYIWILDRGKVIEWEGGKPSRFIGTHTDITAQKDAEKLLATQSRILDLAPFGVMIVESSNDDMFVSYANSTVENILGYKPDALVGRTCHYFAGRKDGDDVKGLSKLKDAILNGLDTQLVLHDRKADGTRFWNRVLIRGLKIAEAENDKTIIVVSDMSEEMALNQALTEAKDDAVEANRMKSLFLTRTSHEIRTPLNAIMGFSQLLTLSNELSESDSDSANEIYKASSYLLNLINDIMEMSRIQAGEMTVSIEDFELSPMLVEIGSVARQLASEKNIRFENSHDSAKGIELQADRTRTKQVIMNLISNAIKYNDHGGEVRINVTVPRTGLVRITVNDTGYGITREQIALIFEPFERLGREQSEIDGTGIGLSISRELVGLMNGRMGVESVPN